MYVAITCIMTCSISKGFVTYHGSLEGEINYNYNYNYLVEFSSSWVTHLLLKVSNCLDAVTSDNLNLSLTTMQPEIQKLASVHQAQRTH